MAAVSTPPSLLLSRVDKSRPGRMKKERYRCHPLDLLLSSFLPPLPSCFNFVSSTISLFPSMRYNNGLLVSTSCKGMTYIYLYIYIQFARFYGRENKFFPLFFSPSLSLSLVGQRGRESNFRCLVHSFWIFYTVIFRYRGGACFLPEGWIFQRAPVNFVSQFSSFISRLFDINMYSRTY